MSETETVTPQKNEGDSLKGKAWEFNLAEQAPDCEIFVNSKIYDLKEVCKNKRVIDIGCGQGHNRKVVESVGGEWVGVEPFSGGGHTVVGDAEDLPFEDNSFDVAIMDSVLEHIPDASKAISEIARVLKPGGYFVGYVAFMECFHGISYSHLSFKALEHFSNINGMKMMKINGGSAFGIDYHLGVLLYPFPFPYFRKLVIWWIRSIFKLKAKALYYKLRFGKKLTREAAKENASLYYKIECLRQSNGFAHVIQKNL